MAAPLAQWVPRLIGLLQAGSWPVHTPFCTSARTVQPTEQWVQTFLRMVTGIPGFGPAIASALRTEPIEAPTPASAAAVRPERLRKARRSRAWRSEAAA